MAPLDEQHAPITLGEWQVDGPACRVVRGGETRTLEPKVMDLLLFLASSPGKVFSREDLLAAIWPGVTVGEDTLARTISRLRKGLDDDPRQPRYLETIPKRGYRLVAEISGTARAQDVEPTKTPGGQYPARRPVALYGLTVAIAILIIAAFMVIPRLSGTPTVSSPAATRAGDDSATRLAQRADDFYMRMTRADNEAAILLYERAISTNPDFAPARAGLANALVQRVIRWQDGVPGGENTTLTEALSEGRTQTVDAERLLTRAEALAQGAVERAPDDPRTLKALGFVYSAQGRTGDAIALYDRVIALDENAWASLINLGELHMAQGRTERAIDRYEQAYVAMARLYDETPQQVGPWHAPLGVSIGRHHEAIGQAVEAEIWYRRVLSLSPLHADVTASLAALLRQNGESEEAERLCARLADRTGGEAQCDGVY